MSGTERRRSISKGAAAWCALLAWAGASAPAAPPAGARLISPAGGERWAAGSRHWIRWEPAGGGPVKLEFSRDGGRSWEAIAAVPDSGAHLWTVPEARRVRVRLAGERESPDLAVLPSAEVDAYAWERVTERAAFAPRDGAGALTFRARMWLLGGWNPGDRVHFPRICNNEVWSSVDGAEWLLEKPNSFRDRTFNPESDWEGRHTAGYVVHRGRMWIVGGDVNQGHYQPDVWSSADGRAWTLENRGRPVPWGPRALHYTVAHDGWIWVLGGQTMPAFSPSEERFYRDIWRSRDGMRWEQVEPREPFWSPRGMIGGSAVFRGRIWILGGGTYDTPRTPTRNFYQDVWSSPDGVRWTRHLERAPWEPRQYHEVAVYDGRLWVLEGYGGRPPANRRDVWYSADGVNWYEVPDTPWRPRHAASVFVHAGSLWMVAGNNMQSDAWRLSRRPRSGRAGAAPSPGKR